LKIKTKFNNKYAQTRDSVLDDQFDYELLNGS